MDPFIEHFDTIRRLYIDEGRKARDVKSKLERIPGFPTLKLKEFTKRLGGLPLRKNLKRHEWTLIDHQLRARGSNKETAVYINGVCQSWKKVSKEIRRAPKQLSVASRTKLPHRVVVRTPSPFLQGTIMIQNHDIRYPDLVEVKQLEKALELQFTSEAALHKLNASIENCQLPWGQFEHLLSKLVFSRATAGSTTSTNELRVFRLNLTNLLNTEFEPIIGDPFMKISPLYNDPRIRFSLEQLAYPSIFAELVGKDANTSLQYATSPIADIKFLIRSIYQLSNKQIRVGRKEDAARVLEAIFSHTRKQIMWHLLMIDHPVVLMAWSELVSLTLVAEDKAMFHLLLKIGDLMPRMDGPTLYRWGYQAAYYQQWQSELKLFLRGGIGNKIRQYLLTLDEPFLEDTPMFIQSCLDRIRPLYPDRTRLQEKFLIALGKRTFYSGDSSARLLQADLVKALFSNGKTRWDENQTVETIRVVAESYPWLYDAFVESRILMGYYPPIAQIFETLQENPTGFPTNFYSVGPWRETNHESFLQLLLFELIRQGNEDLATLDSIKTVLLAGADPNYPIIPSYSRICPYYVLLDLMLDQNEDFYTQEPEYQYRLIKLLLHHGSTISFHRIHLALHHKNSLALPAIIHSASLTDLRHFGPRVFVEAALIYDYKALDLLQSSGLNPTDLSSWQYDEDHPISSGFLGSAISCLCRKEDTISEQSLDMIHYLIGLARHSRDEPVQYEVLLSVLQSILHTEAELSVCVGDGIGDPHMLQICEILEDYGLDINHTLPGMDVGDFFFYGSHDIERDFRFLIEKGMRVTSGCLVSLLLFSKNEHLIWEAIEKCTEVNPLPNNRFIYTPLQAAARRYDVTMVQRLLMLGADIHAISRMNRSALHYALMLGNENHENDPLAVVQCLIENGAEINNTALTHPTPLFLACRTNSIWSLKLVEYIIGQGANIEGNPGYQYVGTPLHAAVEWGGIGVVSLLLEHGARLDQGCGQLGRFVLDTAAQGGKLDIVQLLLSKGAKSCEPGSTGYDGAIRLAGEHGRGAVVQLIQKHISACAQDLEGISLLS